MSIFDIARETHERRQHPRIEVLNPAKILMPDSDTPMVCLVIDWSLGGARLRPYDPDSCPEHFALHARDGIDSNCKVEAAGLGF